MSFASSQGVQNPRHVLYFAYGSFMDIDRMHQFCPRASFVGTGQLFNHQLDFAEPPTDRFRETWGGAPANVYDADGEKVNGVVYELDEESFLLMDRLEEGYDRVLLSALINGEIKEVWVYKLFEDKRTSPRPGATYMSLLIRGARQHGLPIEYVEFLMNIPTDGNAELGSFTQTQE